MRKLPAIILGFVALVVIGGCSSLTPSEACAEFDKEAVSLGVAEDGIAMYKCVPPETAERRT